MLAYLGFSVPVIFTGLLSDRLGSGLALLMFGGVLVCGCVAVALALRLPATLSPASRLPQPPR